MSRSSGLFDLLKVAVTVASGGTAAPVMGAVQAAQTVAQLAASTGSSGTTPTPAAQGQLSPNFGAKDTIVQT